MRIAFITYEYPPDIAQGGIATYVQQAAYLLKDRGHDVEVFCGSHSRTISENVEGVLIHRVKTKNPQAFGEDCLNIFSERHLADSFDVMESPEIHANAKLIKEKFPKLPLVVKLHMASFIQMRLLNYYTSKLAKLRYFLGGLRRGKINIYGSYNYKEDLEYQFTCLADGVVAPSKSVKEIVLKEWFLEEKVVSNIPYPFLPPPELLKIPVNSTNKKVVTFIGKLNVHKGMVNLIKVIPLVAKKYPDVEFRLIGNDSYFAVKKLNMSDYIRRELKGYERNYSIMGGLNYEDILRQFKSTSICIYPSIWENFPLVCLEAMSAGKAIIGSKEGGMNEMLSDGAGEIIDPLNVNQMADAVVNLLDDENLRLQYGNAGRARVLADYNNDLVGKAMEEHYAGIVDLCNLKNKSWEKE